MTWKILLPFFSLIAGFALGMGVILVSNLSQQNISSGDILPFSPFRTFQQLGFVPYWLINDAKADYDEMTTLTYFGLIVDGEGNLVQESLPGETEPGWRSFELGRFEQVAGKYPKANRSLLIHSASEEEIASLISNPAEHARNMMEQVAPLMEEYEFDDLNIDIESFREASDEARQNFVTFLDIVDQELSLRDLGTLTVEIAPITLVRDYLIDPVAVGKIADQIVIMTYDYYYRGSFTAGPIAPVSGAGETWEYDVTSAIELATQIIPENKILLGVPLYGYQWETLRAEPGAPVIPGSSATASQRRVQELLTDCPECVVEVDELAQQPYVIYPENNYFEQIFYEDAVSVKTKIDLAKKYHLGGVAFWAIGYEGEGVF